MKTPNQKEEWGKKKKKKKTYTGFTDNKGKKIFVGDKIEYQINQIYMGQLGYEEGIVDSNKGRFYVDSYKHYVPLSEILNDCNKRL